MRFKMAGHKRVPRSPRPLPRRGAEGDQVRPLGYLFVLALCSLAPASTFAAASVKPVTTLHAQVVRLSDLFADAGTEANRVLGPGPSPGGRIVVEAEQLAYIARRFGVDWRPDAGNEQAVLARPGRPLGEAEVMSTLRSALSAAGASADCAILDAPFTTQVTSVQIDPSAHQFSAVLSITGETIDPISVVLGGRVENTMQVVVATGRLPAGTVLQPEDLRLAPVRASEAGPDPVRNIRDAAGQELREAVLAGQVVAKAELGAPVLVRKNAHVVMRLEGPGLELTGEGLALEPGARGDLIRVQNPASHAVLEAEVTDLDTVRVEPGRPPLIAAGEVKRGALR
jgi:flagellar basal body P-ring formation protein FlgA